MFEDIQAQNFLTTPRYDSSSVDCGLVPVNLVLHQYILNYCWWRRAFSIVVWHI